VKAEEKAEAKEEAVEKVEVRDHILPEAEELKLKPPPPNDR